jgi:hypothetical protein
VVAKWQSSKDWTQVAGAYSLSMADLVSAPVAAGADSEAFNTAFFAQYYDISQPQIAQLRRQGCSWDDINVFANAALQTKQPVTQIASLRSQGTSWADIASRYKVSCTLLTAPAQGQCVTVTPPCPAPCPTTTGAGPAPCPAPCPPAPCPAPCPTVCPAPTSTCCGNGPCQVCNGSGRVILTYDQVVELYSEGYDWLDVAIATRVAVITGYPIRQVLTDLKSFGTWQLTLSDYGVTQSQAFNVADYPFSRRSIYSEGVDSQHTQMIAKYQKPGTWPTCPRGNAPCPGGVGAGVQVVPVPCPSPCGNTPICPNPPAAVPCPCPPTQSQ